MSTAARIAAVILAAGQSRRFGGEVPRSKVVAHIQGVPLVRIVAMVALRSHAVSVTVVSGHDHARVEAALDGLDVRLVYNAAFASGMASSLDAGLAALPDDVDGMLVMLADMPRVQSDTLDALIARFGARRGPIDAVVPTFRGARGNPVLLGKSLFPGLKMLHGDRGARQLLSTPDLVVEDCQVDDPGIAIDVDTPAALQALDRGASASL